jgi:hypothetical protein
MSREVYYNPLVTKLNTQSNSNNNNNNTNSNNDDNSIELFPDKNVRPIQTLTPSEQNDQVYKPVSISNTAMNSDNGLDINSNMFLNDTQNRESTSHLIDLETNEIPTLTYSSKNNHKSLLNLSSLSSLERWLFYTILFLFLILFILGFVSFIEIKRNNSICLTKQCILASSNIYESIDKTIDPCNDFYDYACGNWIEKAIVPTGSSRWGILNIITYYNQIQLRKQFEDSYITQNITEAENKAIKFYTSCVDKTNTIDKLGVKPLRNILDKFIYKDNKTNRLVINESFSNLLTNMQIEYGLQPIFDLSILDDDKNSTFSDIQIAQGVLGIDHSIYNTTSEKNNMVMRFINTLINNKFNLFFLKMKDFDDLQEIICQYFEANFWRYRKCRRRN